MFSLSLGLAKTILQGRVKGGRRQGRQRKRWEDKIRAWTGLEFAKSQRAVENSEKLRKLVAKSSVVPQRPSRLRDRWDVMRWDERDFQIVCVLIVSVWSMLIASFFFLTGKHNAHQALRNSTACLFDDTQRDRCFCGNRENFFFTSKLLIILGGMKSGRTMSLFS